MNIIETQSFEEEDSSLFDGLSEVMNLTEDEQHFFTNFIVG
jgi:hypothetical protein